MFNYFPPNTSYYFFLLPLCLTAFTLPLRRFGFVGGKKKRINKGEDDGVGCEALNDPIPRSPIS